MLCERVHPLGRASSRCWWHAAGQPEGGGLKVMVCSVRRSVEEGMGVTGQVQQQVYMSLVCAMCRTVRDLSML
jgi:hypothetical protein